MLIKKNEKVFERSIVLGVIDFTLIEINGRIKNDNTSTKI